jgi:hypothetical protein
VTADWTVPVAIRSFPAPREMYCWVEADGKIIRKGYEEKNIYLFFIYLFICLVVWLTFVKIKKSIPETSFTLVAVVIGTEVNPDTPDTIEKSATVGGEPDGVTVARSSFPRI